MQSVFKRLLSGPRVAGLLQIVRRHFSSLRAKAALYVVLLLAVTTALSYVITLRIMYEHITGEIIRKAGSLTRSVASASGYSLLSRDLLALDNMVFRIKNSNPDIDYIAILGTRSEIVVHSNLSRAGHRFARGGTRILPAMEEGTLIREVPGPDESTFEIESPIDFMDKPLGSVVLSVNRSVLSAVRAEAQRKAFGLFAAVLAAGMLTTLLISSKLTRPIKELTIGVEELKLGRRSKPLKVYSRDELGRLTSSFNEMAGLITEQKDQLGLVARELEEAYVSTIRVLSAAIDARDHYTLGHSTRVSELALALAREVGLDGHDAEDIEIASLFHDVGKIKIRDSILHKRGRLTPAEFKEMKKHPEYGAQILSKAPSLFRFIPAVRHHHEWYNGTGYPDGLSGGNIPQAASIISLADAYDAMTSDRPYRKAMPKEQALRTIRANSGKQFDPEMVGALVRLIRGKTMPASVTSHAE